MEGEFVPATPEFIVSVWEAYFHGEPLIAGDREYRLADVEALAWRSENGDDLGLVTWAADGDVGEIVSLNALQEGLGIGGRLLEAGERELAARGARRVRTVTTNDNLAALSFYIRHGYRLTRLHLDSMDRVRAAKPDVALKGNDGIPLRDMWELEKPL